MAIIHFVTAGQVKTSSVIGGPDPQSKTYLQNSQAATSGQFSYLEDRFPTQFPYVTKIDDGYYLEGYRILMSGDVTGGGGGGGGDATTLNSQPGSYYLNYANFTGVAGAINSTGRINANNFSGQVLYLDSMFSGSMAEFRGQVNVASNINSTAFVAAGVNSAFLHTGRSRIYSAADGRHNLTNSSIDGYTRLTLGPETVAFPSLKVNSSGLIVRTGNDSANSPLEASTISGSIAVIAPSGNFTNLRITTGSSSSNFTVGGTLAASNGVTSLGALFTAGDAYGFAWNSRSKIISSADGIINFTKNDDSSPTSLVWGASSSATTALKLNGALGLIVRAGDDSANKSLEALNLSGSVSVQSPSGNFPTLNVGNILGLTSLTATNLSGSIRITSPVFSGNMMHATTYVRSPSGYFTDLQVNNFSTTSTATVQALVSNGNISVPSTSYMFQIIGAMRINADADGVGRISNNAGNGFTRLGFGQFGGSGPSLKVNADGFDIRDITDVKHTNLNLRTLSYSGTITQELNNGMRANSYTVDYSVASNHRINISGNTTLAFTAPSGPGRVQLTVYQMSTSGNITWPASVKWPGGAAPTISPVSGNIDMVAFWYNGTNYLGTYAGNFA